MSRCKQVCRSIVTVLFGVLCTGSALADTTAADARIQQLEERVRTLEKTVRMLLEERETGASEQEITGRLFENLAAEPKPDRPADPARLDELGPVSPMPQELLPDLGKIGATVSFFAGGHSGPFDLGRGTLFGGGIDLPLARAPGGRWHYEISLGLAQSETRATVTSNVAQVSNLSVLTALDPTAATNLTDALEGVGAAPFPVTVDALWDLQVLQATPFALKYVNTALDRRRLRPYATIGLGTYVTISRQQASVGLRRDADLPPGFVDTLEAAFGSSSPFGGDLIGGQIGASPELAERGVPRGQGGIDIGFQAGGGIEWRVGKSFSLGFDIRQNWMANGRSYLTFSPRSGFHF